MGGSGPGTPGFRSRKRGVGGIGNGERSGSGKFDCDLFSAKTTLRSPKKSVIDTLDEGDLLDVKLTSGKPPINAVTEEDDIAGSIVIPEQDDLVKCIKKGSVYVVEVLSIEGGTCIVELFAVESD